MPSRERVKELLPVLQVYADGGRIEFGCNGYWEELRAGYELEFNCHTDYRVKPEPAVDGAHAACDVSDGNSGDVWSPEGVADDALHDQNRAWWHDSGVWKPTKVRHWDPGVKVVGAIGKGGKVLFNPTRNEIKAGFEAKFVVVGLCGLARSGKDTAANILASTHGFTRIAFADGMRETLGSLDGATREVTKEFEAAGKNSRWCLQDLGSETREELPDPSSRFLWTDLALLKVRYLAAHHPSPRARFVIPDFRFPHEVDRFKEVLHGWGGCLVMIRMERDGSGLSGSAGAHKSESHAAQLPCDFKITNNDSIANLHARLENAVQVLGLDWFKS
jgi:hypothetical protein